MDRSNWPVKMTTLQMADDEDDEYYASLSAEECIKMVWPMTVHAWTMAGLPIEPRLRRDVVRMIRRQPIEKPTE
jgi:hypothetical protein